MKAKENIRYSLCMIMLTALVVLYACNERNGKETAVAGLMPAGIGDAISCTKIGLTRNDSLLYMNNGGKEFDSTIADKLPASIPDQPGMVYIPGGSFSMGGINPVGMGGGGNEEMNDARPIHRVVVHAFLMDACEVTNMQFEAFVKATGYVTVAEKKPTKQEFPGVPDEDLVAGSAVFAPPATNVSLTDYRNWWRYVSGADWKHPQGPGSDIKGKDSFPVVQVCWQDAAAYAKWAGKRLPTEAEWEFAARGGKTGNLYPWGNELMPANIYQANIFQGKFPEKADARDGFAGIAPVKQFAANDYGLFDMAGNVWEWCSDWYRSDYYHELSQKHTAAEDPGGPANSLDPQEPGLQKKVLRGGSFLCTDQYCTRYMTGTRGKEEWRSAANHIGFRCVKDVF